MISREKMISKISHCLTVPAEVEITGGKTTDPCALKPAVPSAGGTGRSVHRGDRGSPRQGGGAA